MNNLDDKEIRNIFKPLAEGEAPVSSSWDAIADKIPGKGFWNFGWTHLNIFTLTSAIAVVAASILLVISFSAKNDANKTLSSSPQESALPIPVTAEPGKKEDTGKETDQPEKITEQADILPELKPETGDKSDKITATNKTTPTKKAELSPANQVLENSADTAKAVADTSKSDAAKAVADTSKTDSANVQPDSGEDKVPEGGKKIIIFEEETIIQVDTIRTNSKERKRKE